MRRRDFVTAVASTAAVWPLQALADRILIIGLIMANAEEDVEGQERVLSLRESLGALGWKDGANVRIEVR